MNTILSFRNYSMKPAMKKFIIYIRDEYMPSQDMNCKQYQLSIYDEEYTEV